MSRGLYLLSAREFYIKQTENGPQLHHRIPGISLILFYAKSCEFCQTLIPQYKTLPDIVQGVHFGMANVSANEMRIKQMSEATSSKITYVPLLIIYVHGVPFMEYRGPKNKDSIAKFVYEVAAKVNSGQDFSFGKVCNNPKSTIPGYCAGGLEGDNQDDVCMLTYEEAYGGAPPRRGNNSGLYTYEEAYAK